jgi:hypothetical protein
MPGWLTDLLAFLGGLFFGRKSGEVAVQQQEQADENKVQNAVNQARAHAPTDDDGVAARLRGHDA